MENLRKKELKELKGGSIYNPINNGNSIKRIDEVENLNKVAGCKCYYNNSSVTNTNEDDTCQCICG